MSRIRCCVFLSVFLFLSAGCAVLDPGPPMTSVILPVGMPPSSQTGRLPVQLLVARPSAEGSTGSERIMALMNGYEVRALDSAKWASPVPNMVQRQLVDALESTRRFAAVSWEESNVDEKYRLSTDIRRFFLRYDKAGAAPTADITMIFTLVKTATGTIVAREFVRIEEPCEGNSLELFVAAFSRGMTKALSKTTGWVVEQMEAQLAAPMEQQNRKR